VQFVNGWRKRRFDASKISRTQSSPRGQIRWYGDTALGRLVALDDLESVDDFGVDRGLVECENSRGR